MLMSKLGETLVLTSADYKSYGAAFYQRDFLETLSETIPLRTFGPGHVDYDFEDSIQDIFDKIGMVPDTIITSHMWLSDSQKAHICPMPNLNLHAFKGLKVGILNKEYIRLREKLEWFKSEGFHQLFSHSHLAPDFSMETGLPISFLPFAAKTVPLTPSWDYRTIDLGFSGVLRNPFYPESQNNMRREIMSSIFYVLRDLPLVRRASWQEYSISWRSWSGDYLSDLGARLIPNRRRHSPGSYFSTLNNSKTWLNTISPAGLVSTRYFETMAAGSLVITEEAPQLSLIFGAEPYISFSSAADFAEKFTSIMNNPQYGEELSTKAKALISNHHLWRHRIDRFVETLSTY